MRVVPQASVFYADRLIQQRRAQPVTLAPPSFPRQPHSRVTVIPASPSFPRHRHSRVTVIPASPSFPRRREPSNPVLQKKCGCGERLASAGPGFPRRRELDVERLELVSGRETREDVWRQEVKPGESTLMLFDFIVLDFHEQHHQMPADSDRIFDEAIKVGFKMVFFREPRCAASKSQLAARLTGQLA